MPWPALLAILLIALLLAALAYLALAPPWLASLVSHPRPVAGYAQALERVAELNAQEATGINPLCHTQLLAHGQKSACAIAFIHGYTNCPHQFAPLAEQFYARGYDALIVRLPHHGLADRLTDEHRRLTAEELVAYVDQVVDIAAGLGERVTLVGLSGGGVAAAWAAQVRGDLDRAVIIAPNFGFKAVPRPLTTLAANLVLLLPDRVIWWDPLHKDEGRQPHVYPRFTLHGLAQQARLGFATHALARRAPPATRSILVITNAHDPSVDNVATARVVAQWRAQGASDVRTYEFSAELKLGHDLIDPGQPYQRVDVVYPKLMELIDW